MASEDSEKICFVIAPIGEDGSDTRTRSDQVLKHIIAPAADECGYKTIRADQISEPGIITSQVIQHLVDDPLVVADLTDRNPNVFYELAVRHAARKPIVQVIELGQTIPFDVAQSRTIQVNHHNLDSVAACKEELRRQIGVVEKDAQNTDTPISSAIDLKMLRESGEPMEKSLAEIMERIEELRSIIRSDIYAAIEKVSSLEEPKRPQDLGHRVENVFSQLSKLRWMVNEIEVDENNRFSIDRVQEMLNGTIDSTLYLIRILPYFSRAEINELAYQYLERYRKGP